MKKQTITIYDVAREAGVSMATVSRVVNGNPNVKPSTRKKVSEVIERLDYRPNAVARGLAIKRTTTVGVILPSVSDLFFAGLARGIDDIAAMYKYNIILTNSDDSENKEVQMFNTLLSKQVDGIIFLGYQVSDDLLEAAHRTTTPVVFAATDVPNDDDYSVNIDYEKATEDVARLLLERNERLALLTGPAEYYVNQKRKRGFKKAYKEAGKSLDEELIIQTHLPYQESGTIVDLLQQLEADSVIVENDDMAVAVLNELANRGVRIPEEFEIMTSHNSKLTLLCRPDMSSIEFPLYDVGAVAMRLLTKIMSDEEIEEKQIVLPNRIKMRGTTRE